MDDELHIVEYIYMEENFNIDFGDSSKRDPQIQQEVNEVKKRAIEKGIELNPFVLEYFQNSNLFNALPEKLRNNPQELEEYIRNSCAFADLLSIEQQRRHEGDTEGLFSDEVQAGESVNSNNTIRDVESGYRVNVDYLKSLGIDPSKVLFFRVTQPINDGQSKPELYWTSDFYETQKGLRREISAELRKSAVTLVADLETISKASGLIQDVNDDNGLAVRQINQEPFDQNKCLAVIHSY